MLGAEKSARVEENRLLVERFLLPFEIVPFDSSAAREYATIRAQLESKGQLIGPNDMLIAATARSRNAILVTRNTREFKRVPGLKLEEWAEEKGHDAKKLPSLPSKDEVEQREIWCKLSCQKA